MEPEEVASIARLFLIKRGRARGTRKAQITTTKLAEMDGENRLEIFNKSSCYRGINQ